MVLPNGNHVLGAGLLEQIGPRLGIEFFRLEPGNKVFVAEFRLRAEGSQVMGELRRALFVHVPRVPFVAEGGNRVDAPMKENAELGILIPGGNLVLLERVPVGAEWPGLAGRVHLAEERGARGVELMDGFLPRQVVGVGSLRRSGGGDKARKEERVKSHEAPTRL